MKIKEFNTFIRIYSFEIAILFIVIISIISIMLAVTFTPNVETIDLSMII
jgi:hypothetical protein